MAAKDFYKILGVSKDATDEEIKNAYRGLAKKYHPDLQTTKTDAEKKQAEEKFKEINQAYSVLSDKTKKSNYDQFGTEDPSMGGQGGFSGFGGFEDLFGDLFGSFTGGFGGASSRRSNQPMQGSDINMRINLSFDQSLRGFSKEVSFTREHLCYECKGTGAENGTEFTTCDTCNGTGSIVQNRRTMFGDQVVRTGCSKCSGTGKIIKSKCKSCNGNKIVSEKANINVNIPAGISDQQAITYRGQGNAGINGGPAGDIVIIVSVKQSPDFAREGYDLYTSVPIEFTLAALGGKLEVKSAMGEILVHKLASGTQNNTVVRMKGHGVKYINKETYGDLYVKIQIETPTSLSSKQKKLLEQYQSTLVKNENPKVNKYRRDINK